MKKVFLSIAVFLLFLCFEMPAVNADNHPDIAEQGLDSVVSVIMSDNNYGSGFFVLSDQIATCYHVIKDASSGYVSPFGSEDKYPIVGITAIDKDNDLVVLQVSGIHGTRLPVSLNNNVPIQQEIMAVGNPLGYEGTTSPGRITNNSLLNRFLTDAPFNRGNSGGPLLSIPKEGRGEVIGVATKKTLDIYKGMNIAENLNIVVPSRYLIPLIEKAKSGEGRLKPLSVEGLTGTHLTWDSVGYSFTLHNQRNEGLYNVHCLVIFRDNKGVICADQFLMRGEWLYAGQVKRIRRLSSSELVFPETYKHSPRSPARHYSLVGLRARELMRSYEIRILDFDIHLNLTRGFGRPVVQLEGVTGSGFKWLEKTSFSYSLQNNLSEDANDVYSYVVFYDKAGAPIAESRERSQIIIPAMETVTVNNDVFTDVKQLTKRVEFRIFQRIWQ